MSNSPDPSGAIVAGLFLFWGFIVLISLASFVFWIVELIDVYRREFRDPNTKLLWVLMVVFLHGLGALIYYFAGKAQGWLPGDMPMGPQYPPPYSPYPPAAPGAGYSQPPYSQAPPENRQE